MDYVIIIIKTSRTGPRGKNKIVYKLPSQPHHHPRHGNLKKHNSGKRPTVDCTLKTIQHSDVKHSVGKSFLRAGAGTKHLVNWDVLHLDTSNSNG